VAHCTGDGERLQNGRTHESRGLHVIHHCNEVSDILAGVADGKL
jgi:hypothetical protein